jgi:hypothetical protein
MDMSDIKICDEHYKSDLIIEYLKKFESIPILEYFEVYYLIYI